MYQNLYASQLFGSQNLLQPIRYQKTLAVTKDSVKRYSIYIYHIKQDEINQAERIS